MGTEGITIDDAVFQTETQFAVLIEGILWWFDK